MIGSVRVRLSGLAIGSCYVLTARAPHPAELTGELRSPRHWVAEVGPDAAAGTAAGALLWLVALWVALALTATAVSLLPGRLGRLGHAVAHRLTPAALRQVVMATAGTSILLSPVAALAVPGTGGPPTPPGSSALPPIGWPIDPIPATAAGAGPDAVSGSPGASDRVTVRPGDSLWSIAAHRLGPASSAARIHAEWPRWFAANRRLIGADPNLIRPGTRLLRPGASLLASRSAPTGTEK